MRQTLNTGNSPAVPVKTLMLLTLAAAVAGAVAAPAQATYPGKNGPIAFERFTGRDETAKIFSITPTGRRLHRLTTRPGAIFSLDFSPNGSQLAFERDFGRPRRGGIFIVKSGGGRGTRVSTGCTGQCLGDGLPSWSPDGRQILFGRVLGPVVKDNAAEVDLMIMNRDGSGQRLIHRFGRTVDGREPGKAQFSPDGRQIAVTLAPLGKDPRRSVGSAVYVMNADGSNLRPITPAAVTPAGAYGGNVDWSPNGKLIVFTSYGKLPLGRSEIWVVGPNGNGLRRLRRVRRGRDIQPVWSPDGRRIAFGHDSNGRFDFQHIWTMTSKGRRAHPITKPGEPAEILPDWGSR